MAMTEEMASAAEPKDRPYKIFAGRGLYMMVERSGRKVWHVKSRRGGRERKRTVGAYPQISLQAARVLAEEIDFDNPRPPKAPMDLLECLPTALPEQIAYVNLLPKSAGTRIYFIQAGDSGPIKIGISTDVAKRLAGLQASHHEKLRVIATFPGSRKRERFLHFMLREEGLMGEWFAPSAKVMSIAKSRIC